MQIKPTQCSEWNKRVNKIWLKATKRLSDSKNMLLFFSSSFGFFAIANEHIHLIRFEKEEIN